MDGQINQTNHNVLVEKNPPAHQCAEFANLPSTYLEMLFNINLYFKKWSSMQVLTPI